MTRRVEQIGSTLREAVQLVIQRGLSDPRVRGLVTVTRVTVSQDLREATVFVSVLPEEHEKLTMHGLEAGAGYIRREAAELVALAKLPTLRFKVDRGMKNQTAVFKALGEIRTETPSDADQDASPHGPDAASETETGETKADRQTDGGSDR